MSGANGGAAARVDLAERLGEIAGASWVVRGVRDLAAAGVAVGPADPPAWLVRPGSAAEIAQVVRLAGETGAVVVPIGTASRRRSIGGGRPRIVIDVKRLSNVLFLDETSLVVQVQTGITGIGLEELLLPRGLTFGDFPPAALKSTIGGMLSVRTPGKASPRHGLVEDAVLGVSAVLADGRTIHTRVAPRRATGPDLARALLGSEGALGIITGAVLRIHRRAETRLLDAHRLASTEEAIDAALAALRADARPAALRIYDAAEAAAHLGVELRAVDRDGPVVAPGEAVLVAATAGPPDLAAVDRDIIAAACASRGGARLGPGPAETWWRRRFGHAVPGPVPPPPALEVAASPSKLGPVYRAVLAAAAAAKVTGRAHISRFGPDGACLFATLLDGERPASGGPIAAVAAAARAAGGHPVGERDEGMAGYLAALKAELDPHGVFPG